MKKIGIVFYSCLLILCFAAAVRADSGLAGVSETNDPVTHPAWGISLEQWNVGGWFDYLLYYPNQSRLLSKVSSPQNQRISMLQGKYNLPGSDISVRFQYGQSGAGIKGKGSDTDWMNPDSEIVTDYGDFDTYGHQRLAAFDVGRVFNQDEHQKFSVFMGWIRRDSTNELKNVVYHRFNGIDAGDQPQVDIGSTLNGKFQGVHISLEKEQFWSKWAYTAAVGLTALETKAYGHWANHEPAWNWVDTGYTLGWTVNLGIQYAITENVRAELGYSAYNARNYIQLAACDEIITGEGLNENGEYLADQVVLRDDLQGIHMGLKILF